MESIMLQEDASQDNDVFIIKHKRERDYMTLYNDCVNDENLSAESLAFLVYVMSKPEDWRVNLRNLSNRFKIGRDKTDRIIKELCLFGYMKRDQSRTDDGSFSRLLIYASDKPVFLAEVNRSELNSELNELQTKQPFTEIQETVVVEKDDKQPFTENPLTVFQETVPYIQIKDVTKNNNNKITTNPKGACATPDEEKASDLYPEASVVVFFMKEIEGSGVPESTLVGWLRKHGSEYVAEKIRIYQAKGALANPGGFLSAAMTYDWKEKAVAPVSKPEAKACDLTEYPTLDESRAWFKHLTDSEKTGLEQLVLLKHWAFSEMLANSKLTVLDDIFPDSFLFKMMMEFVGRAKR
jgi:hypothetical protein